MEGKIVRFQLDYGVARPAIVLKFDATKKRAALTVFGLPGDANYCYPGDLMTCRHGHFTREDVEHGAGMYEWREYEEATT